MPLWEKVKRVLWISLGCFFVALGIVGVFLPVLPTVPFIIVASFCYAKGSKTLHQKLRNSRWFGHMLRDWEDHRSISARSKSIAIGTLILSIIVILIFAPALWLKVATSLIIVAVATFILTRPTLR